MYRVWRVAAHQMMWAKCDEKKCISLQINLTLLYLQVPPREYYLRPVRLLFLNLCSLKFDT